MGALNKTWDSLDSGIPGSFRLFCYWIIWLSELFDNTGKQCSWIAIQLPALLVEGISQAPMNAEFHSAAARSVNA